MAETSCNQLLIDSATYLLTINSPALKSVATSLYDDIMLGESWAFTPFSVHWALSVTYVTLDDLERCAHITRSAASVSSHNGIQIATKLTLAGCMRANILYSQHRATAVGIMHYMATCNWSSVLGQNSCWGFLCVYIHTHTVLYGSRHGWQYVQSTVIYQWHSQTSFTNGL